ncbi:hypothetical protein BV898_09849 [Hypsibius exemplaris]|uniref:Uncharacterized protein n=1 Tax=Hypsibius exemplaris TaxID=2072580 RepID=A0A1W0WLL0_HYPEX|nr:hypothetical protein BV898_09849 [Hypsibius exemplaris]
MSLLFPCHDLTTSPGLEKAEIALKTSSYSGFVPWDSAAGQKAAEETIYHDIPVHGDTPHRKSGFGSWLRDNNHSFKVHTEYGESRAYLCVQRTNEKSMSSLLMTRDARIMLVPLAPNLVTVDLTTRAEISRARCGCGLRSARRSKSKSRNHFSFDIARFGSSPDRPSYCCVHYVLLLSTRPIAQRFPNKLKNFSANPKKDIVLITGRRTRNRTSSSFVSLASMHCVLGGHRSDRLSETQDFVAERRTVYAYVCDVSNRKDVYRVRQAHPDGSGMSAFW